METLTLEPISAVSGDVHLPGSKSISNRALLLASLAQGRTSIRNLLDSEDTQHMLAALDQLGVEVNQAGASIEVTGKGGPLVQDDRHLELYLGMAGTAFRPLTAALCLGSGTFRLTGNTRMLERPVGHLVDALRALGGCVDYLGNENYPPLEVRGTGLKGGTAQISGEISSQFLTSLQMVAPLAETPVTLEVIGEQVSKPYLDITLALMARFGVHPTHEGHQRFEVPTAQYTSPGEFLVEGDASSATYFLAAAAIAGGPVRVYGLGRDSVQGDVAFLDVLAAMGASVEVGRDHIEVRGGQLRGVDLDLNAIPDAAMTVAVMALFAAGPTRIRNVYNWRVKETDRLAAMANELTKLGASVAEERDALTVTPPAALKPAQIETYGDHRMAMCFSLAALGGVPVTIEDPGCVAKTFPDYFEVLASLCQDQAA
jgi:3-phosphoshikimate 1-carboxyvinyltransferase